jgi:DNA-binding transcriptional LysR family regulator
MRRLTELRARPWNLHRLRIFWTVARQLSYTRAAQQLAIAQPALSHQVKALEAELGTTLFQRRGRGIELTEAGRLLAEVCTDVFHRLDEGERMLVELDAGTRGAVDIAADTTSGTYVVPGVLGAFHRAYPGVDITLHVENRGGVLHRLAERTCDLAVMASPVEEMGIEVEPFLFDALVVIAAPDHPLAGQPAIGLSALAGERFLVREPGSGTRAATERVFARLGRRLHAAMELGSSGAIKQAVAAGLGITVISRWAIEQELQLGRLVVLDVEGFPLERRWSLVNLRARRLSPAARLCRSFLADYAAAGGAG